MESAFPREDGRFTVLPVNQEYDLMCADIDTATSKGWTERLGGLYGVMRRRRRKGKPKMPGRQTVHVPDKCEIPRGYGTIKGKSWVQRVIKGRPITPHTRHVLKHISRTCARGHHIILTQISESSEEGGTWVARMYTTQEYKRRLANPSARMLREVQQAGIPVADIGYVWRM